MMIIQHRVNSSEQLKSTPTNFGVEIDLRSHDGELILAHEPFTSGEKFTDWLQVYGHELLILNVKEEGLEENILNCLESHQVKSYFFLDQPIPTAIRSIKNRYSVALRVSEFEGLSWLDKLTPKWVWLDSFSAGWTDIASILKEMGERSISVCLVSPELQGRTEESEISKLRRVFDEKSIYPQAVCTKEPKYWK